MILVSHPTGNTFSRALLDAAQQQAKLGLFATALGFSGTPGWFGLMPGGLRSELGRRCYSVPGDKFISRPLRETTRLFSRKLGLSGLSRHETGWASVDSVYRDLDRHVARKLSAWTRSRSLDVVYAYEDGALATLTEAKRLGLKAAYDLPIAYWQTVRRLLEEEAQRLPEWEPTLGSTQDSDEKLARKTEELKAAEFVVCPSQFVLDSIPAELRQGRRCLVVEFGSPTVVPRERTKPAGRKIRFLFAGSMGQRKGLADLFAAFRLLKRSDVELVVMGTPAMPLEFYRKHGGDFTYEAPRPHGEVLKLMDSCDVLVLPSIAEGRALVQQEAMSRGLPIIVTKNAGGEDLVDEGQTGFLVPIRSPEAIAGKINWIADHADHLPDMARAAQEKAARLTWPDYGRKILEALGPAGGRKTE